MKRSGINNVFFASWLSLVLALSYSTTGHAEANHTGTDKAKTSSRPSADGVKLPESYEKLLDKLSEGNAVIVKEIKHSLGESKNVRIDIPTVAKFKKWVDTMALHRDTHALCAKNGDESSDLLTLLIDSMVKHMQSAIAIDESFEEATAIDAKMMVTFATQIGRVLDKKQELWKKEGGDAEDEKLRKQVNATVSMFFTEEQLPTDFTHDKQKTDVDAVKAVVATADEAIASMEDRKADSLGTCRVKTEEEKKCKDDEILKDGKCEAKPKKAVECKDDEVLKGDKCVKKDKPKLNPTPTNAGRNATGGSRNDDPTDDTTGDDFGFVPQPQGNVDDFNTNDLLSLLDTVDKEKALREDQALADAERRVQDALDTTKQLADDIARQQLIAEKQQQNVDDGIFKALAGLDANKNADQPVIIPPAPTPAPVLPPPSISGKGSQPLPTPPPYQPPPQQGPIGGGIPPMPYPAPQSSQPVVIEEGGRIIEDYEPRREPLPIVNPQTAGLLEMVRVQNQLLAAQQGGFQAQGSVTLNVNTMANRLSGGVPGGINQPRQQIPVGGQVGGASGANQISTRATGGVNSGAQSVQQNSLSAPGRSAVVPAAISAGATTAN